MTMPVVVNGGAADGGPLDLSHLLERAGEHVIARVGVAATLALELPDLIADGLLLRRRGRLRARLRGKIEIALALGAADSCTASSDPTLPALCSARSCSSSRDDVGWD